MHDIRAIRDNPAAFVSGWSSRGVDEAVVRAAAAFQQAYNAFAGVNEPTPAVTVKLAEQAKPKAKAPAKK
mgnify:CR=1 FL=1